MKQEDSIKGSVDRFFFQSAETGFVVFVLQLPTHDKKEIIVQGHLPSLQIGQDVELIGSWQMHKKFGRQFHALRSINRIPTSLVGIQKYLGSGLIKGIGKTYAEKLVKKFGADILRIIEEEPDRLKEVSGIGEQRVKQISESFVSHKEISELMVFLQERGVSTVYATKIYKQYKQEALAILQENPYRLAEEIWGIGFKKADEIALKMGLAHDSHQRIAAGIIFAITSAAQYGHLYCLLDELREKTVSLLAIEEHAQKDSLLKKAFHKLYDTRKIHLITYNGLHYITLPKFYATEKGVGEILLRLHESKSSLSLDTNTLYQSLRVTKPGEIDLNEEQQQGVLTALTNKVTVITGGPGTGKTTLIKKLLQLLEEHSIRYKLAAPTGRAAKRILEGTGRHATTLHRLLEYNQATMGFKYDASNALPAEVIIIDESSMIDIFLAHSVLKAVPHTAHVVLIGDSNQLPSVGAGNFLHDCIASGVIPCIRLNQIFRQAQDSMIVVNAHRINQGEFPLLTPTGSKKDFIYIKENDPEKAIDHLKKIIFIESKKQGISPEEIMILVPMNKGLIGTQTINQHLQELLNPSTTHQQVIFGGTLYKVRDKVMQIRNNYEKLVFNGDCGIIQTVDTENKLVTVLFDRQLVEYDFSELQELVLAYALSIHKSQGSEYKAVVILLFMQHFALLQRNLIYTALTRAKKLCFFIGQTKALAMGISNTKGLHRATFLSQFLQKIPSL
jgi:exodeoxyribonuclease V alpha subunit